MSRKAVVPLLLVLGIAGSFGIASAGSPKHGLGYVLGLQGTPAPTEWAGVWDTQDSSYIFCAPPGTFSTGKDTICTGQTFDQPEQEFDITCTGSATGTTFHQHCTGTGPVGECTGSFDITTDGTRTSNTYTIVTMSIITISGGGDCGGTFCSRHVSFGTRTGPEPMEYCTTTEVKRTSWGQLKILYR